MQTMQSGWLPHPLISLTILGVWLLLVNSIAPGQILMAALLGYLIPLFSRGFWAELPRIHRPFTLVRLIARLLIDIVVANIHVGWLILRDPQRLRPAFVELPLVLQSNLAITLLNNAICLAPGTVVSDLSADRKYMLIHVLDTDNPQRAAAQLKERYEVLLQEIFEPC